MSNNTDPKIQEIKERHEATTPDWEYNGNEIVSKQNPRCGIGGFLTDADNEAAVEAYQDRAYLLSEIERLQTAQDKVKTELEYIAYVCLDKRCIKAAEEALSHLKG